MDDKIKPGLRAHDGVLMRNGKPWRGIGVNYFNAFYRAILDPQDTSYRRGFAVLKGHGVPCVRFMACGFWPKDWQLYTSDTAAYFELLDHFVKHAEQQNIGLIPSLFWHYPTVPDLVGEPMDCLGDTDSKTHRFMRRYIRRVVERYRESPAIWGWEIGNEYNLPMDLPNASKHRPKVVPSLNTPKTRTGRDEPTSQQMLTALKACAEEIRKLDPHRIIISGNSIPRPGAWHNTHSGTFEQDTQAQYEIIILRDNPDPLDTVSIHLYPHSKDRYFADRKVTIPGLLRVTTSACERVGKPLIIGEFGVPKDKGRPEAERREFKRMLRDIEQSRASLALLWVFDLSSQSGRWNVTQSNDRAYQLELLCETNRRLQGN